MDKHQLRLDKYLWKFVDYDKAFGAQCVDVPKSYCKEVFWFEMWPVGWHAKNTSMARTFRNSPLWRELSWNDGINMRKWDILVSAPTWKNKSWHIWVIDSVSPKWYVLIEQNTLWWGAKFIKGNEIRKRLVLRGKPPILRYFRFVWNK